MRQLPIFLSAAVLSTVLLFCSMCEAHRSPADSNVTATLHECVLRLH
jgi:hypothetical protein